MHLKKKNIHNPISKTILSNKQFCNFNSKIYKHIYFLNFLKSVIIIINSYLYHDDHQSLKILLLKFKIILWPLLLILLFRLFIKFKLNAMTILYRFYFNYLLFFKNIKLYQQKSNLDIIKKKILKKFKIKKTSSY